MTPPYPARQDEDWYETACRSVPALDDPAVRAVVERHPGWLEEWIIPHRVTIETVYGCNARCTMCVISHPSRRRKGVMDLGLFKHTVDRLVPYRDQIEMFDLFALGEPLLDPHIFERIRYVKASGFRRLAISSNAHLLDRERRADLLASGLDTVLLSIDGIRKETHEAIRVRVDFDRAVSNILALIDERNRGGFSTRLIMRFIRQDLNRAEWPEFREFWNSRLSAERGDMVTAYDMHSWAGRIVAKDEICQRVDEIEREPCHHIFNAMMILSNGALALCSEDMLEGAFGFGNVADAGPIDIYNSPRFQAMRRLHLAGRKNCVATCSECTLLYSERRKGLE